MFSSINDRIVHWQHWKKEEKHRRTNHMIGKKNVEERIKDKKVESLVHFFIISGL